MGRLTERNGLLVKSKLSGEFGTQTILQALAEYEDLEEQVLKSTGTDLASMVGEFMHYYNLKKENRLLELPCKVEDAPAVEAKPVVHGEWIFGKSHGEFVEAECSHCKGLLLVKWYDEIDKYRFCPNCGSDMRKKVQE